ncbi:RagB/SusD family nutrient uptake outer membrane protein [Mucilaginibacter sp. HC2]|uniref:RagB/SusD family nutrient uptake outer membrane protein n=1 Tax=Mucilaginibacter inviolabilis TaxID=2714892 RepID=UPI001409ABDA|nr:RagB/SusD family nutrient uptake outer membrane protein [Mucilaginibacter inviolabilis]NHA03488.1 RagB/SusD family nutrient uptake outer membrane protein [Mucilaginibacter inviolabilis]
MNTLFNFRKYILLTGILIGLLVSSCNKQLNILPTDQINADNVFANVNNFTLGVLGVYADWREEYLIRIGSVLSDECRIGTKNTGISLTGSGQNLFRWAFTSSDQEVAAPWTNGYQAISRANYLLASISKVPVKNQTDQATMLNLKGELLAIRAFQHFDLYRIYSYSGLYSATALTIPYVTGTSITNLPTRPTSADFFKALNADLAVADTLISKNNNVINRMGYNALRALEARVALYTNNWTTAIDRTTRVIQNVPLAPATNFPAIWTDQGTTEVIFKLSRTNQSILRPGDLWYNIPYGVYLFAPSTALLNTYDKVNDIRYSSYFSTDTTRTAKGELTDIISKYQGTAGAQNLNDLKVFRTGEMYLIRAEAYARTGNLTNASNDLNTLRSNRITGYQPMSYANLSDLIAAILLERYKELPYEGHRYFDLKRLGLNIVRQTADLPVGITNTTLMPSDKYYYIPIPQNEVLANPNIKPNNPGW